MGSTSPNKNGANILNFGAIPSLILSPYKLVPCTQMASKVEGLLSLLTLIYTQCMQMERVNSYMRVGVYKYYNSTFIVVQCIYFTDVMFCRCSNCWEVGEGEG